MPRRRQSRLRGGVLTDEQVAAAHAARDTARAAMERGDKSFGTQFVAEALTKLLADREYFGCDPLSRISAIIDRNILERMGRKIGDQSYKRNSEVLHSAERFPWCVADAPRAMRSESAIAAARAAIPPSVWRARASTSAATVSSPSPTPALSPVAMPPLPPTLPAASASAAMPPLPPALSDLAPAFPPLPARGGSGGGTGSGFNSDDEDELDDVPVLPWQSMVFADGGHEHADEHADEDDDDDVEEEESKQDNVKADDDSGRASPATMRMALLYHMLGQIAEVVAETRTDVRRMADDLRTLLPKVKADAEPTEVKAEVKAEPVEVKAEPVEVKAEPVVEVKAEPPKPAAKKPFVPDYSMPPGPTLREQEEARAAALVSAARVLAETTKRPRVDLSGTGIAGRLGVMRPTHAAMRHA